MCAWQGVRVTEVPISMDSLNSGDVFILDLGAKIYVWTGASASAIEKNKALTHTIALRDDRDHQGKSQVCAWISIPRGSTYLCSPIQCIGNVGLVFHSAGCSRSGLDSEFKVSASYRAMSGIQLS